MYTFDFFLPVAYLICGFLHFLIVVIVFYLATNPSRYRFADKPSTSRDDGFLNSRLLDWVVAPLVTSLLFVSFMHVLGYGIPGLGRGEDKPNWVRSLDLVCIFLVGVLYVLAITSVKARCRKLNERTGIN